MDLNIELLKIRSNNVKPCKGRILIAEPLLPDYLFSRSVILLTGKHRDSYEGIILNHASAMKVGEVMSDFEDYDADLYIGGPVDNDVLFYLHRYGDLIPGSKRVFGDVYFGGDYNSMLQLFKSGVIKCDSIRFFIGYSGWNYGQLFDEINENSWLVTDIDDSFVFSDNNNLWERSLGYVDRRYDIWKNFPEDPEWN